MPDTVAHLVPITGTPLHHRPVRRRGAESGRADLLARYTDVSNAGVTPDFVALVGVTA
jgi:hypothetical protein